jgi:type I restriction enzyme R subunit
MIFTTLQKFSPEEGATGYPVLTDRRNVIVIADEAHRSQYGFRAKVTALPSICAMGCPTPHSSASPGRSAVRCARQFR